MAVWISPDEIVFDWDGCTALSYRGLSIDLGRQDKIELRFARAISMARGDRSVLIETAAEKVVQYVATLSAHQRLELVVAR